MSRSATGVLPYPLLIVLAGWSGLICAADTEPLSPEAPVATIGNQTIPFADVQREAEAKLADAQRQFDIRQRQILLGNLRSRAAYVEATVERLVDDRVLGLEAARRRTTPDALLAALKAADVADSEVRNFYDSQRADIGQPFESVAPQIKQLLQRQAADLIKRQYLDALRVKYKAVISWEPRREEVDAAGPRRGAERPIVTIVEFADFQCPFCGRFEPVLQRILRTYPNQVRLIYRNFPLPTLHPDAEKSAEAATCADAQGKFWAMHDILFAEQDSLSVAAIKAKAKRIGLDAGTFDQCLDSGGGLQGVQADVAAGEALGVESTPTSFVNGRFMSGARSFENLARLIDDELRRASLKPPR